VTLPYGKPLPLEAAVEQEQEQLLVRVGGWSARRDAYARAHARARGPAARYYGTLYWILVEYTSHQYRTTVKIRPICNFSLILKFPFTPRIYFTTQSDCEVSSKVTVGQSEFQFWSD